jgi:hypothetical protein
LAEWEAIINFFKLGHTDLRHQTVGHADLSKST